MRMIPIARQDYALDHTARQCVTPQSGSRKERPVRSTTPSRSSPRAPSRSGPRRTRSFAQGPRPRRTVGSAARRPRRRGPDASSPRTAPACGPPAPARGPLGDTGRRVPSGIRHTAAPRDNAPARGPSAPGSTCPDRHDPPSRQRSRRHRGSAHPAHRDRTRPARRSAARSRRSRRRARPRRSRPPPPPCTRRRPGAPATQQDPWAPGRRGPRPRPAPLGAATPRAGCSRAPPTRAGHRLATPRRAPARSGTDRRNAVKARLDTRCLRLLQHQLRHQRPVRARVARAATGTREPAGRTTRAALPARRRAG